MLKPAVASIRLSVKVCMVRCFCTSHHLLSKGQVQDNKELLVKTNLNQVTTLRMNNPKKLNSWDYPFIKRLVQVLGELSVDNETKVVILTGTDPYYSAGVSVSSSSSVMGTPRTIKNTLRDKNYEMFNTFIEFPKPIIAAINGPAIGATLTSAALSDYLIASEKATFSTPFNKIGLVPEGCSSVHFERIMGKENADKMIKQDWIPDAKKAKEIGLVQEVVEHDKLLPRAQELAEQWVKDGKKRWLLAEAEEYKKINKRESEELALAFLSERFFDSQYKFLKDRNKHSQARVFWLLKASRPLWKHFL